tara:strand:+ start:723 stop:1106 length:384 start_codon:yes stop_codon:yes gene_type:complete
MAHIVLAEDDSAMRSFIAKALEKAGHTVSAHGDGLEALGRFESAATQDGSNVDLLLADIVMPGMDGIELSQRATASHPNLKVMFITGFAAVAMDNAKTAQSEQTKLLSKPFHLKDLVAQVDAMLAAS